VIGLGEAEAVIYQALGGIPSAVRIEDDEKQVTVVLRYPGD